MSLLDVPGAHLYFETYGDGPLLVLIPGAGGTADVFRMLTRHWFATRSWYARSSRSSRL